MKLLSRLRDHSLQAYSLITMENDSMASFDALDFNNELLGVGASMEQDIAGMEFLDGIRRKISDIHEDFPPHGMIYQTEDTELEF